MTQETHEQINHITTLVGFAVAITAIIIGLIDMFIIHISVLAYIILMIVAILNCTFKYSILGRF